MKLSWASPIITRVKGEIQIAKDDFQVGIVPAIFNFFQGRATFFALVFLCVAVAFAVAMLWGFLHGKDTSGLSSNLLALATYMGALQALLFAHSCKEDWVEIQHRRLDQAQPAGNSSSNQPQS